jgi:hypothetical protein
MKNDNNQKKKLYCPICEMEVFATYLETKGNMDRYECPNENSPDEKHGIFIAPDEEDFHEMDDNKVIQKRTITSTEHFDYENSNPNRFAKWIRRGLEHLGFHILLGRLFPTNHPTSDLPKIKITKPDDIEIELDHSKFDSETEPDIDFDSSSDSLGDTLDGITI